MIARHTHRSVHCLQPTNMLALLGGKLGLGIDHSQVGWVFGQIVWGVQGAEEAVDQVLDVSLQLGEDVGIRDGIVLWWCCWRGGCRYHEVLGLLVEGRDVDVAVGLRAGHQGFHRVVRGRGAGQVDNVGGVRLVQDLVDGLLGLWIWVKVLGK